MEMKDLITVIRVDVCHLPSNMTSRYHHSPLPDQSAYSLIYFKLIRYTGSRDGHRPQLLHEHIEFEVGRDSFSFLPALYLIVYKINSNSSDDYFVIKCFGSLPNDRYS